MKTNETKTKCIDSYLTFKMSEEIFGVNVKNVLNILEKTKITEIPKMPDFFLGVIDLRGTVLPLIDPRKKLGLAIQEDTNHTCILVLENRIEGEYRQLNILVDKVEEVLEIEEGSIEIAHNSHNGIDPRSFKGLYEYNNDSFIIIIYADEFFYTDELGNTSTLSEGLVPHNP